MLIALKHRFAFLAIPKTGTTSIEKALQKDVEISMARPPNVKHMTAPVFEKFMRPYLQHIGAGDVQTLAVMRDPISQLESWYSYRRRTDGDSIMKDPNNSTQNVSFEEFIEGYLSDSPPKHARVGSQARFLGCETGGEPMVDYLFAQEKMSDLIAFLEKRIGRPLEVEKRNVSPREPLELTAALRNRLTSALAVDIALHQRVLNKSFHAPRKTSGG